MSSTERVHDQSLSAARHRREALHTAMVELEAASAAPLHRRWTQRLRQALGDAARVVDEHVEQVEGPEGMFEQVLHDEPRMASRVERLRHEHEQLRTRVQEAQRRCDETDCPPDVLREVVIELVGLLARHRQAGADLLYEAYEVDVSAAD